MDQRITNTKQQANIWHIFHNPVKKSNQTALHFALQNMQLLHGLPKTHRFLDVHLKWD